MRALEALGPFLARDQREVGSFIEGSQDQDTYRGKQCALTDFIGPLFIQFNTQLFCKERIERKATSHKGK